ncbi:MAG: YaaR family protein [Treponemataceae bacterium]|nr:YaaR family protein [Treponemataceae bacterium]
MSQVNLNDSLFYNAALESAKLEAKKKQADLKSRETKGPGATKSFNQFFEESKEKLELNTDIPEIQGMDFEQAEQFLIDEVYSKGDLLKKSPLTENFIKYKKAVQNFLKFVESQCYELEETKGAPLKVKGKVRSITKQKKYTLVKLVNEKLESLASDILYNQRDQIKMIAKVDQITGLLVDVLY